MSKEGFYFPHYQDARRDIKIQRLRRDLGIEGYGIYFMLLEILREQPDYKFPLQDIELLVSELQTTRAKIEVVIANYELFQTEAKEDGKVFFSPRQIHLLLPYTRKKELAKMANEKSQESRRNKHESSANKLSLFEQISEDLKTTNMSSIGSISHKDDLVNMSSSDSISPIRTEQIREEKKEEKNYYKKRSAPEGARSSEELFEKWVGIKSQGARNTLAYAATLRQGYWQKDPNILTEFEAWMRKNALSDELQAAHALKGLFLQTKSGVLQICGVEHNDGQFHIYFSEGGFAIVSTLQNLPICNERI